MPRTQTLSLSEFRTERDAKGRAWTRSSQVKSRTDESCRRSGLKRLACGPWPCPPSRSFTRRQRSGVSDQRASWRRAMGRPCAFQALHVLLSPRSNGDGHWSNSMAFRRVGCHHLWRRTNRQDRDATELGRRSCRRSIFTGRSIVTPAFPSQGVLHLPQPFLPSPSAGPYVRDLRRPYSATRSHEPTPTLPEMAHLPPGQTYPMTVIRLPILVPAQSVSHMRAVPQSSMAARRPPPCLPPMRS